MVERDGMGGCNGGGDMTVDITILIAVLGFALSVGTFFGGRLFGVLAR